MTDTDSIHASTGERVMSDLMLAARDIVDSTLCGESEGESAGGDREGRDKDEGEGPPVFCDVRDNTPPRVGDCENDEAPSLSSIRDTLTDTDSDNTDAHIYDQTTMSDTNTCTSFSCLHWNIGGLASKLNDTDFVDYVATFDFVCLVETFMRDFSSSAFPSHTHFVRSSIDLGRRGRDSGGIVCLVRSTLVQYFRQLDVKNDGNFLAFIVDKKLFGNTTDVLFICAYVPPEFSPFYNVFNVENGISLLEEFITDCSQASGDLPVLLCGDLNGRTSNILPERYDESYIYDARHNNDDETYTRNSEDTVLNNYGKMLLNMCSAMNLCIMNGVCKGDQQGSLTFISEFGNSVNDYYSFDLFDVIAYSSCLTVGEQIDSQHMPLELKMLFEGEINSDLESDLISDHVNKIVWDDNFRENFLFEVSSQWFKQILDSVLDLIPDDVNAALELFNNALKKCADCMSKEVLSSKSKRFDGFDNECVQARRHLRKLLRKFKKMPIKTDGAREDYCKSRREYKNLVNKKRRDHNDKLYAELLESVNDQRAFWKTVNKMGGRKIKQKNNISLQKWHDHFKSILDQQEDIEDVENLNSNSAENIDTLDDPISREEVLKAIHKLRCKKAAGTDGIIAELFKVARDEVVEILVKLFNKLFDEGIYPDEWCESIILPLYKKGDVNNTNNYRGISLCNISSKIYGVIINDRLQEWIELNNTTGEYQAGYKHGYSTIDHIFTLMSIVQKQLVNNRKLYVAFIDFEKAFDSISRKLLWPILLKNGINGKMFSCLKSMYKDVKAKVRSNGKFTSLINCSKGVKQGDVCSPVLFSLFINELALEIISNGRHGVRLSQDAIELFILLFADDLVLLSETAVGLQAQLNTLHSASVRLQLKVNMSKSNIIVFRKGGYLASRERWFVGGQKMDVVNAYKYLGVYFSTKLSFTYACEDLASRAKRATMCILKTLYKFDRLSYPVYIKLFDAQVQPIVQYAAEIWGLGYANVIEKAHLFALKRFLGVHGRTPNDLVYGEVGRYPIYLNSYVRCIKYWLRVVMMEDHRLPSQAYRCLYELDGKGKITWASMIRQCLCKYGFHYVWLNQGVTCIDSFIKCFTQRLIDCHWQNWDSHMQNSDRFSMYCTFKSSHVAEPYLFLPLNKYIVQALVRFRLGISLLAEHTNRYRENCETTCRLCHTGIENEVHLVLRCPSLAVQRQELIPAKYYSTPSRFKLSLLLAAQNTTVLHNLAIFLYRSMKILETTL